MGQQSNPASGFGQLPQDQLRNKPSMTCINAAVRNLWSLVEGRSILLQKSVLSSCWELVLAYSVECRISLLWDPGLPMERTETVIPYCSLTFLWPPPSSSLALEPVRVLVCRANIRPDSCTDCADCTDPFGQKPGWLPWLAQQKDSFEVRVQMDMGEGGSAKDTPCWTDLLSTRVDQNMHRISEGGDVHFPATPQSLPAASLVDYKERDIDANGRQSQFVWFINDSDELLTLPASVFSLERHSPSDLTLITDVHISIGFSTTRLEKKIIK